MKTQSPKHQRDFENQSFRNGIQQMIKTALSCTFTLLSVTSLNAQSYTHPDASGPTMVNGQTVSMGQQNYRVVSADQYLSGTKSKAPAQRSQVKQANAMDNPADLEFAQSFIETKSASQLVEQVSCNSCEPTRGSSMKEQLDRACTSCGSPGGAYGCIHCDSYFYGVAEAIHVDRDNDDTATISSRYGLSGFEMEMGSRITVGRVPNCVRGWEGTFTGIINWNSRGGHQSPTPIQSDVLFPVAPLTQDKISAFFDANQQSVNYDARYWSAELNRTYVGWEVAKMLCGIRYIDFEEQYSVDSENDTESGSIYSDIDNRLIGFQIGMDLTYPILKKTYVDFRGRAGIYANFMDLDLAVINDNEWSAGVNDRSVEAAGQFELGVGLRYQVSPKFSLKCGTELWYLSGIGTAYDQLNNGIMGRDSVEGYEDLINAVFTYGGEIRY